MRPEAILRVTLPRLSICLYHAKRSLIRKRKPCSTKIRLRTWLENEVIGYVIYRDRTIAHNFIE